MELYRFESKIRILNKIAEERRSYPMTAYNGRIAIAGIAESDYGRVPNMTELQLHAQAIQRALADSGLRKKDIDGVFCSSDTMSMPTVTLCEYMRVFPRYTDSTSIGGASFEAHQANQAISPYRLPLRL